MNEIAKHDIALTAAYLASNLDFAISRIENKRGLTNFSRRGNVILCIVLPRYHKGLQVDHQISNNSALDDIALIRLMVMQAREIIEEQRKTDYHYADWVENLLIKYCREVAQRLLEIRSQAAIGCEVLS